MGGKLIIYFDRCVGKRFPSFLRKAQPPFEIKSHFICGFPHNLKDDEWLSIAGKNKWIVVTHDRKFHKIPSEFAAIIQHKVKCFYLPGEESRFWIKLKHFVRTSERITKLAQNEKPPFIFQISGRGIFNRIKIEKFE